MLTPANCLTPHYHRQKLLQYTDMSVHECVCVKANRKVQPGLRNTTVKRHESQSLVQLCHLLIICVCV